MSRIELTSNYANAIKTKAQSNNRDLGGLHAFMSRGQDNKPGCCTRPATNDHFIRKRGGEKLMKRAIGFTFLTLVVFSLIQILGSPLQAQSRIWNQGNQPRDGACFYVDENYRGEEFCVDANESQRSIGARYDNRITSVRIFGRAGITVYDNENFGGSRQTFSQDVPNLQNWSDRITSFQFTADRQYGERDGSQARDRQYGERRNEPRNGICFYVDENYKGEEFCVDSNESQRRIGARYDNRISSIRIFNRAEITVYENENFTGSRQTFSQNVPKLRNWSDRITSFQFTTDRQYGERDSQAGDRQYGGRNGSQAGGRYGRWSRGNELRDGVCFYMDGDYQGEEFCIDGNESQRKIAERYNDRISSVRISGRTQVVVYEHENFGGTRRILNSDTPNLGDFNDKITSIEVAGDRSGSSEAGDKVCFYVDRDYQGEEFCVDGNGSQRKIAERYNDRISSARIPGGTQVVVYEHENFGGARRVLTNDTPGLGDFNDKITSIEVRGRGRTTVNN